MSTRATSTSAVQFGDGVPGIFTASGVGAP